MNKEMQVKESKLYMGFDVLDNELHNSPHLESWFFDQLKNILLNLIGPIAPIIIEEEVNALGYDILCFPPERVDELVELLSAQIIITGKQKLFRDEADRLVKML